MFQSKLTSNIYFPCLRSFLTGNKVKGEKKYIFASPFCLRNKQPQEAKSTKARPRHGDASPGMAHTEQGAAPGLLLGALECCQVGWRSPSQCLGASLPLACPAAEPAGWIWSLQCSLGSGEGWYQHWVKRQSIHLLGGEGQGFGRGFRSLLKPYNTLSAPQNTGLALLCLAPTTRKNCSPPSLCSWH